MQMLMFWVLAICQRISPSLEWFTADRLAKKSADRLAKKNTDRLAKKNPTG